MATLNELVSLFRGKTKSMSDDTRFPDRMIISAFNIIRSKILKDEASRKELSRQNYIGFCMDLCVGTPLKCPCIAIAQCNALVSKYNLPKTIDIRKGQSIYIRTGSGYMLEQMSPIQANSMNLNPAFKNKPSYWIENYRGDRYLVIWNANLDLDVIYIDMIPENLDDIADIPECGSTSDDAASCIDWTTESYPLDSNLEYQLFVLAEQLLLTSVRPGDDYINDNVDQVN